MSPVAQEYVWSRYHGIVDAAKTYLTQNEDQLANSSVPKIELGRERDSAVTLMHSAELPE